MKKKDLEIRLEKIRNFDGPDASLEQYMTPAVIASDILFTAYAEGDIHGMNVIDIGCGTGMFAIGAWLLGAESLKGYDISEKAISVASENVKEFGASVELITCDVSEITEKADTAVMNPPFGCQNRRADRSFLDTAMRTCDSVYSVHMNETSDFLEEYVNSAGKEICFRKSYKFNIPHTFTFHRRENHSVDIIMIMIR